MTIQGQSIGVASTAQGFSGVDGILGIGPTDLTQGTVSSDQLVLTVTDNLFSQGSIPAESIGIFYQPTTTEGELNGELTFGGVDSTKSVSPNLVHEVSHAHKSCFRETRITGDVNYVPITSTSPANAYWGTDQSITYGHDGQTLLSTTAGIVDTGTTLVLIASDAFEAYQNATGGKMDHTTGLLTVTESQYDNMQSMFFNIGGLFVHVCLCDIVSDHC